MSDLSDLADDLYRASDNILDEAERVVSKGSLNVKTEAREIISGASTHGYLPHYPRSITYDLDRDAVSVTGTIGPDAALMQGPLGSILEDGAPTSAPIPHLNPALDAEEPRTEQAAADLGVRLLERR